MARPSDKPEAYALRCVGLFVLRSLVGRLHDSRGRFRGSLARTMFFCQQPRARTHQNRGYSRQLRSTAAARDRSAKVEQFNGMGICLICWGADFLSSSAVSDFITGQTIVVDGGSVNT